MTTGASKQFSQMNTSIPMVIQLLFLVLVYDGLQLADGCLDNTITLEDGFTGQLKFCDGQDWGAVCSLHNDDFTQVDSQVVCYELGYSGDGADFTIGINNIPGKYIALKARVDCRGDEERLSECQNKTFTLRERNKCEHFHRSVHVTCSKESQVRLHNHEEGKNQDYRGVVEHYYNGAWHVLCDTGNWTLKDSQVVCRQLGLGNAVEPGYKCEGSIGSLDYLQNNIHCQNDEVMIRKCRAEKHWNTLSTCDGTVVNVMCEGPVVQDITITSSTSQSVTLSWKLPQNFNKAVVTKFRVEYWPEGHKSQKHCFDQSSNFSDATLEFLTPDTTYEMVIVPMMGEHPGNNSKVHSVKTGENPVIVGLSCAVVVMGIIIIIPIILKIGRFMQRLRCGVPQAAAGRGNEDNVNNHNANENRPLLNNNNDNNQHQGVEANEAFYEAIADSFNKRDGNNGGSSQEENA